MKKVLIYLTIILVIVFGVASYDMVAYDGNVFLNKIFRNDVVIEEDYVKPEIEEVGFGENPYDKDIKEKKEVKVELEEKEEPVYIEPENEVEDENLAQYDSKRGYEYYFSQLNEEEKEIYRVIYKAFSEVGSGNVMPTSNEKKIEKVMFCVKNDHPEFFYIQELGFVHYTLHDQIQSTTLAVTYTDSKAAIDMQRKQIEKEADRILSGISTGASDYEKVKYIYETVINETDYDLSSTDNQNIVSVMLNHKSVCAGYARSVQYLLNRMGIPTTFVEGVTSDGSNHAWNMCLVDGEYYYLDATWGDSSYSSNKFNSNEIIEHINYDYLLITTEEIERTHTSKASVGFPQCTCKDNNYYVREGLYFTEYDENRLQEIINVAYESDDPCVAIKCDNMALFDEFETNLIRKEGIFKFLKSDTGSLSYMTDEEQRTLCFWL